jgi:hypothetical protein
MPSPLPECSLERLQHVVIENLQNHKKYQFHPECYNLHQKSSKRLISKGHLSDITNMACGILADSARRMSPKRRAPGICDWSIRIKQGEIISDAY